MHPKIHVVSPGVLRFKALVYGEAGAGKTTLLGSANGHPALAPVLFLDLEGGLGSVMGVHAWRITSSAELDEAYLMLARGAAELKPYKTVVIDSGTVYAQKVLAEWTARNIFRKYKGNVPTGDGARTVDDIELQDYGKMTSQVRRMMGQFRDLDRHLLVSALQRSEYVEIERQRRIVGVRPDFTERLGETLNGVFDCVWYLFKTLDQQGQTIRVLYPDTTGLYFAKTRGLRFLPALGPYVVNPTLPALYDLYLRSEGGQAA